MSRPTVVIAEDNMLIQDAIRMHLMAEFQVLATVEDGQDAVNAVSRLHPNVLLLDGTLPSLNGLGVARAVKQSWPEVKIIFVTAENGQAYRDEAFRAGASGYVLKSRIITELSDAIRSALSERLEIR